MLDHPWRAAWCLHDSGDASAGTWVARHACALLAGGVQQTAAIEEAARTAGLRGAQRKGIDEAVNHLTGKAEHLHCDTALEGGWPITTGSIERACRHLVKTAWTSPAPAGARPEPKPYSSCVPSAPAATSTPTGPGTSSRN
ncbi:hypothetical protein [Streptomyces europaeiscabiei]|uniref:hypothetical protein n=1 Tax=Streptomyces europaeiscabiei TaxID=146819 RepID=UPI000765CBB5|nr:hypothetical protein [Streptomyces europaeiscabiei]MDX3665236.1 hypothetical protein [Streptomyces europaeiscabiei]